MAVVHIINKQSSKYISIMSLVGRLVLACMKHNTLLRCVHIPGKHNILPELVFRLQVKEFHCLAPDMDKVPNSNTRLPFRSEIMTIRQYLLDYSWPSLHVNHIGACINCATISMIFSYLVNKYRYPISASKLSKFIAFWVARGYKPSSIESLLSGLSYIHVLNVWLNPVCHFLIKKCY